ncbi:hypothetical protein SLEP1_g54866 [Rubroshorea leprosula]|uniref:Uncharacterized protein n=1 Tax=Rubroshorea leprosula TaxID=152421 RepID=A0AAV5MHT2_9ROSI|nr:hypothetical protein SLEP1_g54866 [Rubroshorea leprosula]
MVPRVYIDGLGIGIDPLLMRFLLTKSSSIGTVLGGLY